VTLDRVARKALKRDLLTAGVRRRDEMRHDDEKSVMVRQPNFYHDILMRCAKFDFNKFRESRSRG
jgi:hypothetical protein